MNPHLVADVGNSRIKWAVCAQVEGRPAVVRRASLPDDPEAWRQQFDEWLEDFPPWRRIGALTWVLAGVRPERCARLRDWLTARGHHVVVLESHRQLPIAVGVREPGRVGLDRLLNAVAAKRDLLPGKPAVLVDAGSAVTVDWLDETHTFRGGAIFPGFSMMAKALHEHTALLPEVAIRPPIPALPGASTTTAIQAGVFWAVLGGVERIAKRLGRTATLPPEVFLTGGDAEWLVEALDENDDQPWLDSFQRTLWPEQTLEGILHAALSLPSPNG